MLSTFACVCVLLYCQAKAVLTLELEKIQSRLNPSEVWLTAACQNDSLIRKQEVC